MNRKFPKITTLVTFLFVITVLVACGHSYTPYYVFEINRDIEKCTGTMLTMEEVKEKTAQLKKNQVMIDDPVIEIVADDDGNVMKKTLVCDTSSIDSIAAETSFFDIITLEKDEESGIYKGIKVIPSEDDYYFETEDDETELVEETTEETTTEATEPEGMSVDDYLKWLDGWWKLEGKTNAFNMLGMIKANEALGEVEYSIDSETGGLRVLITGETTYEYVYVYIDEDHLQYIDRTFDHEHIYERTDPPEGKT